MNYLQKYQSKLGLVTDGIVGKETARAICNDLKINSMTNFCHFIAQVQHESSNFTVSRENLNYSSVALRGKFGKYFKEGEEYDFARHPEQIANRIYANRLGNGNSDSGEGWYYRGIGGIQLTGKKNILAYLAYCNLPLDTNLEELIELEPRHYFNTGKFFFDRDSIWEYCLHNSMSILTVSKCVNLGNPFSQSTPFGIDERRKLTLSYFSRLL